MTTEQHPPGYSTKTAAELRAAFVKRKAKPAEAPPASTPPTQKKPRDRSDEVVPTPGLPPSTPDSHDSDLVLAATNLFGGVSTDIPLRTGKVCTIRPATMKQIPVILDFFTRVLNGMDKETLAGLVDLMADRQKAAIKDGGNPFGINLGDMATVDLVTSAFGKVNLFTSLFASVITQLPQLCASFTNLTPDEYGDLPPDEGILVVSGVFMVNYSFFTQSLPPILTVFIRSLAGKNAVVQSMVKASPRK